MKTRPGRQRRPKNTITTRSGKTLKINRSLVNRSKARKTARTTAKAAYLSTLPKNRYLRLLYRMHPMRVAQYWFSREGGVMALKIIGLSIVVGFFMTIGLFAYFRKDLPKIKDLSGDSLGGNTIYYDRTGQTVLFNDYNSVKRLPVDSKSISPFMKQATVAIEDKGFYKHGAFDVRGIMRAAVHDATGGSGPVEGGSSITQQLVKLNENWTDNRTVTRKVKELILAVELEREYSKDDVLTGYLNIAPYGGSEYGVESAARDYFQTSAKDLTLEQATMLAAIPQAPSYYSPYSSSKYNPAVTGNFFSEPALIGRQHYILDQMVKQGYIKQKDADAAKKVDILAEVHQQADKYQNIKAPYFVLAAKHELEQTYGATTIQRGGWKVTTTLDLNLQTKAESLVASNLNSIKRYGADQEAMAGEDVQTGQMVTLVGGTDFSNPDYGQNNYAAGILIPPGSSFKPYDYATLINNNNNVGAGSVLYDTKTPLPGYEGTCSYPPTFTHPCPGGTNPFLYDYDFIFPGPLTLRYAMGGSRNVPAVKAMLSAVPNDKSKLHVDSVNKVISTAGAMMDNKYYQSKKISPYNCYSDEALTETTQCYGASAIGDGAFLHLDDHVNGLSTLGRMGQAIPRTYIMKITDAGQKTLYQWKQPTPTQAIKADAAYIVNDMASDYKASYLPGSCTETTCTALSRGGYKFQRFNGWHFGVKTGTTNDGYDGLMTSWSTKYAMVSWVGNHTRHVTLRTSMENLTEPLTRPWMEYAHQDAKPVNWTAPSDIKTAPAFVVRNHIHFGDIEPSPTNDLFPSWYAGGGSTKNTSQTLDKVSGKVATSCTPALAKSLAYNSNAASWNIDIFNGGKQSVAGSAGTSTTTPAATDDVHNCNDSPPTVTLTAPASCPASGCTITATITQGTHALSDSRYPSYPGSVSFTLGGQTIHSQNVSASPSTISFNYTPTSTGNGTLSATVTDSVLYQGSDSASISYTTPTAPTLTLTGSTPTSALIQWSGGVGPFTAFLNNNPSTSCQNVSGSNCTVSGPFTPNSTIIVKDSGGRSSNAVTISGH